MKMMKRILLGCMLICAGTFASVNPDQIVFAPGAQFSYTGTLERKMTRDNRSASARLSFRRDHFVMENGKDLLTVRIANVATVGTTSLVMGPPDANVTKSTIGPRLAFAASAVKPASGAASQFVDEWNFPRLTGIVLDAGAEWNEEGWLTSGSQALMKADFSYHVTGPEEIAPRKCLKVERHLKDPLPLQRDASQTAIDGPITVHQYSEIFWISDSDPWLIRYEKKLILDWMPANEKTSTRTEEFTELKLFEYRTLKGQDLDTTSRQFEEMLAIQEAMSVSPDASDMQKTVSSQQERIKRFRGRYRKPIVPDFLSSMEQRVLELKRVSEQMARTKQVLTRMMGTNAPPFTLYDLTGGPVSLPQFAGNVVLLHFWGIT